MLLALVPFGWLNWAAFLFVGLRSRRPLWVGFAGVYFVAAAVSLTLRLARAESALHARRFALELAKRDPGHARDLGVGRPDLEGSFDGG